MSTEVESAFLAGKDAASKEREDRLENARKKLKKYRARTSKSSAGSSMSSSASSRRDSMISNPQSISDADALGHRHRRSISKSSLGLASPAPGTPKLHARKVSKSRGSRGGSFGGGHGHTRSRASISISVSGPSSIPASPFGGLEHDSRRSSLVGAPPLAQQKTPLNTPASWARNGNGSFPNSPELAGQDSFASSSAYQHTPSDPTASSSSHVSNGSLSASGPPNAHARRPSRHSRRSSVANFRESLEIVSGSVLTGATLQPGVGSFSATSPLDSPPSPSGSTRSLSPGFPTDPARVLEALKERGRRESETESDSEQTRQVALEALEGRLAAPSPMIDLGTEANGALLVAPPSPGYIGGVPAPASPSMSAFASPMVGIGLGQKRNSWSAGPVIAAGAKGAMDLGVLAEEDEEEEDVVAPLPSPKRVRSASKKRPTSLRLSPPSSLGAIAVGSPADETTLTSSFATRPMRLSLSLSSAASSVGTPSTAASPSTPQRASSLRSLTLTADSTPLDRSPSDERSVSPSERRHHSLFHSVAAASANSATSLARSSSHSPSPPTNNRGGLRSLSIGNLAASPSSDTSSPLSRRTASTSTAGPRSATKRSSISYRNTSGSSLASPEGPLSAASQAARRPWRTSTSSSTSASSSAAPTPSSTLGGYAFPFAPSHGNFGGFGELEVEETDEEDIVSPTRSTFATTGPISDDPAVLSMQIAALRTQIDQLRTQSSHVNSTHALEIAEFEKKAGEEARTMRKRIGELERQLEEGRVGRRFEVEGLSREIEQAREAMLDLTEERDSLREDVDGWRERCASLEQSAKRDREDDSLASAQAKLIGEMRDQIYSLVAALERERGEHAETRQEIDRLLTQQTSSSQEDDDDDEEAALGVRGEVGGSRHGLQTASDGSILSSFGRSFSGNTTENTSITTEDDSFSKMSSPLSGHSSFGQAIGFSVGSKRDSDFANSALDTLAEEDEEEGDSSKEGERVRQSSGSTGSTAASEAMPLTPNKDTPSHNRSDSFVRQWRFPDKGSISSVRISEDFHSFFDLGRHASLPALPIADSILPPFLGADLTVDEDAFPVYEPHKPFQRPSSPRPSERMVPHNRRYSGQYAPKAHGELSSASTSVAATPMLPKNVGRFSGLMGSLGGWSSTPAAAVAASPVAPALVPIPMTVAPPPKRSLVSKVDEREVLASTRHQTPPSLLHSSRTNLRYIKAGQQPVPKASRLALLDFTPICCSHEGILVV